MTALFESALSVALRKSGAEAMAAPEAAVFLRN
jgi:hypothetical protein